MSSSKSLQFVLCLPLVDIIKAFVTAFKPDVSPHMHLSLEKTIVCYYIRIVILVMFPKLLLKKESHLVSTCTLASAVAIPVHCTISRSPSCI